MMVLIAFVGLIVGLMLCGWAVKNATPPVPNEHMICPHCQTKGTVITMPITQKTGVSGGKATAAILTGGTSLLATGLSHKVHATACHCQTCDARWTF